MDANEIEAARKLVREARYRYMEGHPCSSYVTPLTAAVEQLSVALEQAQAERDRMREALKWYGNKENWGRPTSLNDWFDLLVPEDGTCIDHDGGEIARRALGQEK